MTNRSIAISKTAESNIHNIDFNDIPFGKFMSDHMFIVDYIDGAWVNPEIKPLQKLQIHPANLALHYGQSIFEGMKATKGASGTPLLFRPMEHLTRINRSAERMDMPSFPAELFEEAVHLLTGIEKDWIPPMEGSALYLRPVMFAMDDYLGVKSSKTYKFIIFCLPVGPYYPKPVSLKVEEEYVRAVEGGVGAAKTAGNYAASLYPSRLAKEQGYDQIMWMDAKEFKYIQEVGTMNIFFKINNKVVTPALNGAILQGITRDSVITMLKHKGYDVEERNVSIDEVIAAHKSGELQEVFGTGTAAVVSEVYRIGFRGENYDLNPENYTLSKEIKKTINGMRSEQIADEFNWIVPVNEMAFSS